MVLEARYGSGGRHQMIVFLAQGDVRVEPVTEEQARIALDAYRRFGKGRQAAGLNYGDCFAYALAVSQGEELLYKGTDFAATDLAD
jgi:ribonuclease VapC